MEMGCALIKVAGLIYRGLWLFEIMKYKVTEAVITTLPYERM